MIFTWTHKICFTWTHTIHIWVYGSTLGAFWLMWWQCLVALRVKSAEVATDCFGASYSSSSRITDHLINYYNVHTNFPFISQLYLTLAVEKWIDIPTFRTAVLSPCKRTGIFPHAQLAADLLGFWVFFPTLYIWREKALLELTFSYLARNLLPC